MSNSTLKATIQFRRNYTEDWELYKNTIPAAGEPCFDLDLKTLKIGDGVTTYENLHAIGGISLSVDNKTIIISDDTFKLFGFDAAEIGAQPRKGENSKLEWIVPSGETLEGLQTIVSGLQTDLANLQTDVSNIQEVLNSSSDGKKPLLDRVIILEDQMTGIEAGAQVNRIESISVGGTLLDIINKSVNIPIAGTTLGVVKASDEVIIGADGTLGLGKVSLSKIVQGDNETLVLDGGTSII